MRLKLHFIPLVMIIFGITSCKKEYTLNKAEYGKHHRQSSGDTTVIGDTNYKTQVDPNVFMCEYPVKLVHSMLEFSDSAMFEEVLLCLENNDNLWNDKFLEEWGHLDDDELEKKEEEISFNDYFTLELFESSYGLHSLRKLIYDAELIWLDNDELVFENDPNDHQILNPYLRTILNQYGEIKIGEFIYIYHKVGDIYIIGDEDYGIVDSIRAGTFQYNESIHPHVIFSKAERSACIRFQKRSFNEPNGKKKIHGFLEFRQKVGRIRRVNANQWDIDWFGKVKTRLESYKWKASKRKWKKYKTNLAIGIPKAVVFEDCNGELSKSLKVKTKRRKSFCRNIKFPGDDVQHQPYDENIKANFGGNGINRNLEL